MAVARPDENAFSPFGNFQPIDSMQCIASDDPRIKYREGVHRLSETHPHYLEGANPVRAPDVTKLPRQRIP
jgi:hypothetical protein